MPTSRQHGSMTEGKVGLRKAQRSGSNIEKLTLLRLTQYKEIIQLVKFGHKTVADEARIFNFHQALL